MAMGFLPFVTARDIIFLNSFYLWAFYVGSCGIALKRLTQLPEPNPGLGKTAEMKN